MELQFANILLLGLFIAMANPLAGSTKPGPDAATTPTMTLSIPPSLLTAKESLNLVVTDSGLGGLSVVADMAQRAEASKLYREFNITFANSLFRPAAGYNSLASREDKIAIFNNALRSMKERYKPDAILVACNTLSVLLPDCEEARDEQTPVIGIIETGVDMIAEAIDANPDLTVMIFATQTTVDEDSHRQALIERGIAPERLVIQACPELTWYIEQEPEGFETELMISNYVGDALAKRADTSGKVAISFNCTHYGYAAKVWQSEVENQGASLAATLDPNARMADFLFPPDAPARFASTKVSVQAVSMVEIQEQPVKALGPVLAATSEVTAAALRNWKLVPGLFEWESVVISKPDNSK